MVGTSSQVLGHLGDGVAARAGGQRQGDEHLVGRVRVDGAVVDVLEGEQLIDRLVGDGLGRLAAPAEADEVLGAFPSCSATLGPPPGWGPTGGRARSRRSARARPDAPRPGPASVRRYPAGAGRHRPRPGCGSGVLARPGRPAGASAGSIQASSRPPLRGRSRPGHRQRDRGAEVGQVAARGRREEGERRGLLVERAAGEGDADGTVGAQGQGEVQGLEHEGRRARRADVIVRSRGS